jgi:hypothetical protein
MFSFSIGKFGSDETFDTNLETLIGFKRLLPKWLNSIPDSEFALLFKSACDGAKKGGVLVETGCGSSTLALVAAALLYDTKAYSWDINSSKLSAVTGFMVETIFRSIPSENIWARWIPIGIDSLSEYAGLSILGELNEKCCFFFHDSTHTWEVMSREIKAILEVRASTLILCLDDANYGFESSNSGYGNLVRSKLGLPRMLGARGHGQPFYERIPTLLEDLGLKYETIQHSLAKDLVMDLYVKYFSGEMKVKFDLGMEVESDLGNRFASFKVVNR